MIRIPTKAPGGGRLNEVSPRWAISDALVEGFEGACAAVWGQLSDDGKIRMVEGLSQLEPRPQTPDDKRAHEYVLRTFFNAHSDRDQDPARRGDAAGHGHGNSPVGGPEVVQGAPLVVNPLDASFRVGRR